MTHNALIVEDNPDIASLIQLHLKDIHCNADIANDGGLGLKRFEEGSYDLVILDWMLPGMDGLEVCKRLRSHNPVTPIIMLTSKSSEIDRVLGLEVGADDYIAKPFSLPELMARVRSQFRRLEAIKTQDSNKSPEKLVFNDLVIETDKHRVTVNSKPLDLTAKEFELLLHFAKHPGRVYSRTDLLDEVWGYSYEGYEHTVNSHINRLRTKIEDNPSKPDYIITVWGVGYKFNDELK